MLVLIPFLLLSTVAAWHGSLHFPTKSTTRHVLSPVRQMAMSDKGKEPRKSDPASEVSPWERIKKSLKESGEPNKKNGPPIYEPGSYQTHLLSALAYVVPIADASDLGKYVFEAYPAVATAYNAIFGPVVAVYNGVPFLPFGVFFLMSYICRAPTFPIEVRFHVAQAFMLSLIQFVPSIGFGLLEKADFPFINVAYNSGAFS